MAIGFGYALTGLTTGGETLPHVTRDALNNFGPAAQAKLKQLGDGDINKGALQVDDAHVMGDKTDSHSFRKKEGGEQNDVFAPTRSNEHAQTQNQWRTAMQMFNRPVA
jgi:hypothetical protein